MTGPVVIAEGLGFTEAPLWTMAGELYVASVSRGLVYRVAEGTPAVVAETGGGPSGLAQDAGGAVWVAQGGPDRRSRSTRPVRPGIQRLRDGQVVDVVAVGLHSPCDCAIVPDGRLWFTDPRGPALHGRPEPGRLRVLDPATGIVTTVADDLLFPNGLAGSPDGEWLYVAETAANRVVRHALTGPAARTLFARLPHPDGIAVDAAGNVHVASPTDDSVHVIDPAGRPVDRVELPRGCFPTSVCFGGPGLTTLFVTAARGGRVFAVAR